MDWKRGAYPEFTLEDAVAVLFMLRNPTGRKAVSEALNIGEGSVRTLLKKLSRLGVITSTRRGHSLNDRGMALLGRISRNFSGVEKVGTVEGYPAYGLIVRNPGEFNSINLRDEAVRFFARGAMILEVRNGEPVFPEDGRSLSETLPELAGSIKRLLKPGEGDLVVVTWAGEEAHAVKSAYHVALTLKGEEIPEEIKTLAR
ncbi:hypothetical protein A3L12_02090 [Thermococcus sp. P6]|uniref:DUF4443 domain-containing protein n=1 Tax=Thermococcus sp. P6 TaxID=122420 RepID=UPI000B5A1599|nr:DUF4443 domain-containing protein [Thermococcus sp. P6]ASJ10167.1 hypothetical protein A3L12_02090 [Thermococcus sp. P6]